MRNNNLCKNFTLGLLFMVTVFELILICFQTSQITSINSDTHIQKQNELLKQNSVIGIDTNSSCNGNEEVSYQIPATRDGCKCSEQLYAKSCTKSQIELQNCIQINSYDSYKVNKFPFQQNDDINFAFKICYVKSKTSMYQQIRQNNTCSDQQKQCGDKENNNHICVMKEENCPISDFQFFINEKQNQKPIRMSNNQTNYHEPLIGIVVTNGFCQGRRNSSNYPLNTKQDDCQFEQYMIPIAKYPVQQILQVNKIKEYYNNTRQFDDLQYQLYVIYGLRYLVPSQCRLENKIFDQQDNILNFEIRLKCMAIVLLIWYIPNLYYKYCILQQIHIRKWIYLVYSGLIMILILIQLVLSIIYQQNLQKECLNFQLATINYSYPIINSIFLIIQCIIALILNPKNQNQVGQEGQNQEIQIIQEGVNNQHVQDQQVQDIANPQVEGHEQNQEVVHLQNEVNETNQEHNKATEQTQNVTQKNLIDKKQGDQEILNHQNINVNSQEIIENIFSPSSFQSTVSGNTQNNQNQQKKKIRRLNRNFKQSKESQSSKKLITNINPSQIYPEQTKDLLRYEI